MADTSDESWEFYFCQINQAPASVFVNLAWADRSCDDKTHLVMARIPLRAPREDGFPERAEGELLAVLEDQVNEALEPRNILCVGRITTAGFRDFFFYGPPLAGLEAQVRAAFTAAGWAPRAVVMTFEPNWQTYRELLYPDSDELEWIQDRRVVDALRDAGDDLSVPRPVSHWLFFTDENSRTAVTDSLVAQGFEVALDKSDHAWIARAARTDSVELSHIHQVTRLLRREAEAVGGTYDGWETGVVMGQVD